MKMKQGSVAQTRLVRPATCRRAVFEVWWAMGMVTKNVVTAATDVMLL
jgi:hypothetical protein